MRLYRGGGAGNSFITGGIYSRIKNNSNATIKLVKFNLYESTDSPEVYSLLAYKSDINAYLCPGEMYELGIPNAKMAYNPMGLWVFEYNGATYSLTHTYGRDKW